MPDSRETLLVCFLGDSSAGSSDFPRVVVQAQNGTVEEVRLSAHPRRLLRFLALPPDTSLAGLRRRGSSNRLAEVLAAPPPQRRMSEVAEALFCSRSNAWRIQGRLRSELEEQRLAGHLHKEVRGSIGLRNATSDVALLYGAVRDQRWELAARVLAVAAPADREAVQLLPDEGWSAEARAQIRDALREAKRHLPPVAQPGNANVPLAVDVLLEPDEEYVEGEVVDDGATGVVLAGPRGLTPWPRRRRRLRRAMLLAATLLLLVGLAVVLDSSPEASLSPLQIPASRAGAWPEGSDIEIANLTRGIPFGAPLVAEPGDTLMVGVRLDVTEDSAAGWHQPFALETSVNPQSSTEDGVSVSFTGPSLPNGNDSALSGVTGVTPEQRLRLVPGSTVLLDGSGRVVRHLADIDLNARYRLPRLRVGQIYYVEWRLESATMPESVDGQISEPETVNCIHPHQRPPYNTEALPGDTLDCSLNLINWGPRALRDVHLKVSWGRAPSPHQLRLFARASATGAEPEVTPFQPGFLSVEPLWPLTTLEYVPGSERLVSRRGRKVAGLSGEAIEGATIQSLPAGEANALRLVFRLRVISAGADGDHTKL